MRKCPKCGSRSEVIDSRETENSIRRRRGCIKCSSRWTTFEMSAGDARALDKLRDATSTARRALKEVEASVTPDPRNSL